jgi:site-specific recombinase XerC
MSQPTPSRVTLTHVLAAIHASDLPPRLKQELTASVRTVARAIGMDPASIEADPRTLAVKLRRIAPVALGLSAGRWNNIRSHLRAALGLVRPMLKGRNPAPMSPAWQALHDAHPFPSERYKLSRLLRWLSEQGIEPEDVTRADLERYRQLLVDATLIANVDAKFRETLQVWNRAARQVPGWPQVLIEGEARSNPVTLDWSVFPPSLKQDFDGWQARLAGADPFDAEAPPRPLRPATLKGLAYDMQAFASALVHRGRQPADLTTIAACLTIENYKEGLRFFLDRLGQTTRVAQLAAGMRSVARHWVKASEAVLKEMAEIAQRLAVPQTGMTAKNRMRLRATDDPAARERLRSLPWTLKAEVDAGKHGPVHSRVLAELATMIAIQFVAPLRIRNLAALEIGRHLVTVGSDLMIVIERAETKTGKMDLVFEMPEPIAEIIRWYINAHRKPDADSPHLFPGTKGRAKAKRTIQAQMVETIHKYTGLAWNVHLFRHFGAREFLRENPGGHEVVRQVLGHSNITSTTRAYAGLEGEDAARYFGQKMMERRAAATAASESVGASKKKPKK